MDPGVRAGGDAAADDGERPLDEIEPWSFAPRGPRISSVPSGPTVNVAEKGGLAAAVPFVFVILFAVDRSDAVGLSEAADRDHPERGVELDPAKV